MKLIYRQSTGNFFFIVLAFASLTLLISTAWIAIQQPYSGIQWAFRTGDITYISPDSPALNLFQIGCRIISINSKPVLNAREFPGKSAGDLVTLVYKNREGLIRSVTFHLVQPPITEIANRLGIFGITIIFWLLAGLILAYGYENHGYGTFVIFVYLLVALLSLGSVSSFAPIWMAWFFHLAEIWIGPVAIQAHLYFPQPAFLNPRMTLLKKLLYPAAGLISLICLGFEIFQPATFWPRTLILAWTGFTGIILIAFFADQLAFSKDRIASSNLATVLVSIILAFAPLTFFNLIPNALFAQTILPSNISLMFLILIPFGYAYAIFRKKLIRLEKYSNYVVVMGITASLFGGLYGITFLAFRNLDMIPEQFRLFTELTLFLSLSLTVYPFFQIVSGKLRTLLYGSWRDEQSTIELVSHALSVSPGDLQTTLEILGQSLMQAMQIEFVRIILQEKTIFLTVGKEERPQSVIAEFSVYKPLFEFSLKTPAYQLMPIRELEQLLEMHDIPLDKLTIGKAQAWLYIDRKTQPICLIILGKQRGGKEFGQRDIRMLNILFRQAIVSIENAVLAEELELRARVIRQLHQRLAIAREDERKQLSHDLHDHIIQSLVSINYQLFQARRLLVIQASNLVPLQEELHQILVETRQICADLRPPALDAVGVIQFMHARIFELREQVPFRVIYQVFGDETINIPTECASILYVVFQEGIQNIRKHALPTIVEFTLELTVENLKLVISDNGLGFQLPQRLELFTLQHHFGLVGMQERVASIGGNFSILTSPGQGCRLECRLPLVSIKSTESNLDKNSDLKVNIKS